MEFTNLSRYGRAAGVITVIACLLLVLPCSVSGYTALSGSEFIIYPSGDWTKLNVQGGESYVSFIPFYDNTNVLAYVVEDNGSETLIFNGTRNKAQAVDLAFDDLGKIPNMDPQPSQATGPRWVHILSNRSGYVFVGVHGSLRSPPSSGGGFYDTHFIIHWPEGGWNKYFADICTHYNGTVNVTMTPIDAATGLHHGTQTDINFSLNGTGNATEPYCRHVQLYDTDGNTNIGITYIVNATQGVFVLQHLDHIDTFNWLGAFDTGLLFGKVVIYASMEADAAVSVYNPGSSTVNCSLYEHVGTGPGSTTAGYFNFSDRTRRASITLQPYDYGFLKWTGSDKDHIMMICNGSVSGVGGGRSDVHNLNGIDSHPYTRLPPVYGQDTLYETPFAMDSSSVKGDSWVFYQSSCDFPTIIDFYDYVHTENRGFSANEGNSTICFNNAKAPGKNGLGIQAFNTTVLFANNLSTNSTMTVDCQAGGTVSISGNQINLTNCKSSYEDNYFYNATIDLIDMNFEEVTAGREFKISAANSSWGAVFGFNITGRVVLDWAHADDGTSCLHQVTLWERGMFHISGTKGVYGTGFEGGSDWNNGDILRFNSSESLNVYRVAHKDCSNSPIESTAPYIVTTINVSDKDILIGDNTNVTGTVSNPPILSRTSFN